MKDYIPLKVEFCLYENILCGKILQQDNRLIKQIDTVAKYSEIFLKLIGIIMIIASVFLYYKTFYPFFS